MSSLVKLLSVPLVIAASNSMLEFANGLQLRGSKAVPEPVEGDDDICGTSTSSKTEPGAPIFTNTAVSTDEARSSPVTIGSSVWLKKSTESTPSSARQIVKLATVTRIASEDFEVEPNSQSTSDERVLHSAAAFTPVESPRKRTTGEVLVKNTTVLSASTALEEKNEASSDIFAGASGITKVFSSESPVQTTAIQKPQVRPLSLLRSESPSPPGSPSMHVQFSPTCVLRDSTNHVDEEISMKPCVKTTDDSIFSVQKFSELDIAKNPMGDEDLPAPVTAATASPTVAVPFKVGKFVKDIIKPALEDGNFTIDGFSKQQQYEKNSVKEEDFLNKWFQKNSSIGVTRYSQGSNSSKKVGQSKQQLDVFSGLQFILDAREQSQIRPVAGTYFFHTENKYIYYDETDKSGRGVETTTRKAKLEAHAFEAPEKIDLAIRSDKERTAMLLGNSTRFSVLEGVVDEGLLDEPQMKSLECPRYVGPIPSSVNMEDRRSVPIDTDAVPPAYKPGSPVGFKLAGSDDDDVDSDDESSTSSVSCTATPAPDSESQLTTGFFDTNSYHFNELMRIKNDGALYTVDAAGNETRVPKYGKFIIGSVTGKPFHVDAEEGEFEKVFRMSDEERTVYFHDMRLYMQREQQIQYYYDLLELFSHGPVENSSDERKMKIFVRKNATQFSNVFQHKFEEYIDFRYECEYDYAIEEYGDEFIDVVKKLGRANVQTMLESLGVGRLETGTEAPEY